MVLVTPKNGLFSFSARGRLGMPNGLGVIFLGWNSLGYENDRAGTYQRHRTSKGKKTIFLRQNWPNNPKYAAQIIRQNVFKAGIVAWKALTPSERLAYNAQYKRKYFTGYTGFMANYLKTH